MKLSIRTRHLSLSPETQTELRQRVVVAFARISPWVRAVDITVADINGPKGGADKQCRLRVRGRSIPDIVVEHVGCDTIATVALAVERAGQALVRKMARRRGFAPILAF
jgi:hypothetical protein